mmetsp:Transcript_77799/g.220024  ORF Transcript_77799/g.220024 Transcript_77799/m.220024 type:complete len:205 (+) Transcript_77799:945-1559(+)
MGRPNFSCASWFRRHHAHARPCVPSGMMYGSQCSRILFDTTLRRSSSLTNRRPCWSRRMPPLPRRASGPRYFVWLPGSAGSMNAVGWSCTLSMSMRFAPRSLPKLMPSPLVKAPFVVGTPTRSGRYFCMRLPSEWSKPKPPVVTITASAMSSETDPAPSSYSIPLTSTKSFSPVSQMSLLTLQEVFTSMPSMASTARRACCMIV